ncbi:MAG TPA: hypothetical protein VKX45_08540 [Bryobacteraceae bacterium]|nr:hypothetical protein [Bryobacteraceae bacterium]
MRATIGWLFPDIALVAAAVTLFYCLFLFQGYQTLFRDSDAGWHIRTGESILATGRLPRTDPYSFTKAGQPWFAWEWAADVAAGAVHRAAGLRGVALFYALVIAAGVWMWFRLHWATGGNFLIACAMAPLLLTTCSIHWLARPHVIGWLLLLAIVWWCERGGGAWGVAAIAALWANLHASFFLAAVVAAAYSLRPRRRPDGPSRSAVPVLAALVAPLLNPYGWRLYGHVYRYLTDSDLLSRIGEFQSFDFHAAGAGQIAAALIVAIAGGTLALVLGRTHHFLLAMFFSVLALRSARALPLAALVALPIANAAVARFLPWKPFVAYAERLRAIDARLNGLALAPVMALAAFVLLRYTPAGFPPDQFPVAAYDHLAPGGRLFAPDKFGGYLIYRSGGARKVFFDGRSDFYGAEFLKQYGRLVQVRPGWQKYWNEFHFSRALLPNDAPLLAALEQAGWRPVYHDGTVTILDPGGT